LFAIFVVACVSAFPFSRKLVNNEVLLNYPRDDIVNYTPNPLPCQLQVSLQCEMRKNGILESSSTVSIYVHDTYLRGNTTEPGFNKIRLIRPDLQSQQGGESCAKFFEVDTYHTPSDKCTEKCLSAEDIRTEIDNILYDNTHVSLFMRKEDGVYQGQKCTIYITESNTYNRTFYVDSDNMLLACIIVMGTGSGRTNYTYIYGYSHDVPFDIFVMDKMLSTKCDPLSYIPPTKRICKETPKPIRGVHHHKHHHAGEKFNLAMNHVENDIFHQRQH